MLTLEDGRHQGCIRECLHVEGLSEPIALYIVTLYRRGNISHRWEYMLLSERDALSAALALQQFGVPHPWGGWFTTGHQLIGHTIPS